MPQIGVIDLGKTDNAGDDLAVVVVRVLESDTTPHQTSDGRIFIRTGDISKLEEGGEDAGADRIRFLLNRREKSIELKQSLLNRAKKRIRVASGFTLFGAFCIPSFPSLPIVDDPLTLIDDRIVGIYLLQFIYDEILYAGFSVAPAAIEPNHNGLFVRPPSNLLSHFPCEMTHADLIVCRIRYRRFE